MIRTIIINNLIEKRLHYKKRNRATIFYNAIKMPIVIID